MATNKSVGTRRARRSRIVEASRSNRLSYGTKFIIQLIVCCIIAAACFTMKNKGGESAIISSVIKECVNYNIDYYGLIDSARDSFLNIFSRKEAIPASRLEKDGRRNAI